MKKISEILHQNFLNKKSNYIIDSLENNFIVEGIVIDKYNKTVSLNDSNRGVDFEGPIYWKDKDNIDMISIFKRTKLDNFNDPYDGNPFIYALKDIKGWTFDITDAEIIKYLRKFINNCKKLQQNFDTIIIIPSGNDLNRRFMNKLFNLIKADFKIEKLIKKISLNVDDIEQFIDYELISKEFPDNHRNIEIQIEDILYEHQSKNKEFSAKDVDKQLLRYIKFLQINDDPNSIEKINDKNVLVLDDIYSSGSSIYRAVEAIKQNYNPKSLTGVTLLSKVMK